MTVIHARVSLTHVIQILSLARGQSTTVDGIMRRAHYFPWGSERRIISNIVNNRRRNKRRNKRHGKNDVIKQETYAGK